MGGQRAQVDTSPRRVSPGLAVCAKAEEDRKSFEFSWFSFSYRNLCLPRAPNPSTSLLAWSLRLALVLKLASRCLKGSFQSKTASGEGEGSVQ